MLMCSQIIFNICNTLLFYIHLQHHVTLLSGSNGLLQPTSSSQTAHSSATKSKPASSSSVWGNEDTTLNSQHTGDASSNSLQNEVITNENNESYTDTVTTDNQSIHHKNKAMALTHLCRILKGRNLLTKFASSYSTYDVSNHFFLEALSHKICRISDLETAGGKNVLTTNSQKTIFIIKIMQEIQRKLHLFQRTDSSDQSSNKIIASENSYPVVGFTQNKDVSTTTGEQEDDNTEVLQDDLLPQEALQLALDETNTTTLLDILHELVQGQREESQVGISTRQQMNEDLSDLSMGKVCCS